MKNKNTKAFEKFDMDFSMNSDDELLNTAFDSASINTMDRDDMTNLIEELARRYQRLLDINDALN